MTKPVLIIGETIAGSLSAGTESLGRQASGLGAIFGGKPCGVLFSQDAEQAAQKWANASAMDVTGIEHPDFRYPNPVLAGAVIGQMIDATNPVAVCLPHSMRTCQLAASLAWLLKAPLVTAVQSISRKDNYWTMKRSVFNGKLVETVAVSGKPVILTLMPGVFPPEDKKTEAQPAFRVEVKTAEDTRISYHPVSLQREKATDQALEKATVVVAGGRGLKEAEKASLLESVAGIFKKAAVGGSRGACDLGWLPQSKQIGETGRTVAPELYLACGISGAPQHLAGMQGSRTIVVVNTDPMAAILHIAQYAVIDDLSVFLPTLKERYNRRNR